MQIRIILALLLPFTAFAQQVPIAPQGDICTLHFSVIQYFPMVDAMINGTHGKLMFDTGIEDAFSFNDHLISQTGGRKIGSGFAGSGQSYDVKKYDTLQDIQIGEALRFSNSGPVKGHNMDYLEKVTPDFLGFIGHNFFQGYLFKTDYKKGLITFYKSTPDRRKSKDFLKGEKVIAVLDFQTGKLPNHPMVHIKVNGVEVLGLFDTGQLGAIYLSDSLQRLLTDQKMIVPSSHPPIASLKEIEFAEGSRVSLDEVYNFPAGQAQGFKNAMGITAENILSLGYSFLKQYKIVWDYELHQLYLLKN